MRPVVTRQHKHHIMLSLGVNIQVDCTIFNYATQVRFYEVTPMDCWEPRLDPVARRVLAVAYPVMLVRIPAFYPETESIGFERPFLAFIAGLVH